MSASHSLPKTKWNRTTAAHLACRTGFGPSLTDWDRLASLSPEEAVEELMSHPADNVVESTPEWFKEENAMLRRPGAGMMMSMRELPEEERREAQRAYRKDMSRKARSLPAWWLERMVTTPTPFEEKLTLFWHGHFATSVRKVRHPTPMLIQNLMFRDKGRGNWRELLEAISADPAMLVYLDNHRSKRRKPNENYARELMELFSLGEGNYTEEDIRAAARAFTGWTLNRERWEYRFQGRQHDPGMKTFMGETKAFTGADILDKIASLPRTSEYMAERMWRFFASETPNPEAISDIAKAFHESKGDLNAALRTLFLHEAFYEPSVVRGKIKSPVELTVYLVRSVAPDKVKGDPISRVCRNLGQTLFEPPSVKGWDGGSAWITSSSLAYRYSAAEKMVSRRNSFDIDTLLPDRTISRIELRNNLMDRFYFSRLREQDREAVDAILANLPPPRNLKRKDLIPVLSHIVQQPQYQLC